MIIINDIYDVLKYLDNIKVVIFDLDDTLFSEREYVKSGFFSIEKKYPFIKADELFDSFQKGDSAIDVVLNKIKRIDLKEEVLTTYRFHEPSIRLYPNALKLLNRLKGLYGLGIITDGRVEGQKKKINALGIKEFFDKIIITDELGGCMFRKPCKVAYIEMKNFFGCDFSKMVYVGDNPVKDFIAPKELGMKSIYFKNSEGLYSI